MIKKQRNKKKIYSKKRVLRGGEITDAVFDQSGVLHSLLTDAQTRYPDFAKKTILTQPVCNKWFDNIRRHEKSNNIIDPITKKLILNEQKEIINATKNARSAIKFCEEKMQALSLQPDIIVKSGATKEEEFHLDRDEEGLPLGHNEEEELPLDHDEKELTLGHNEASVYVNIDEEIILQQQLSVKLEELKKLLSESNHLYYYQDCQKYLEHVFNERMKMLLHSIQSLHYFEKKDVCKYIKSLFEHLKFTIVPPVPLSEHFTLTEGFFIGIEKHRPPSIPKQYGDAVICNAFRIFDDFVNNLMTLINIDNDMTKFKEEDLFTKPPRFNLSKKLFLVLTHVDESYISIMERCIVSYLPRLYLETLTSMIHANLPENVFSSLQKYYTIVVSEENDEDIEGEDATGQHHQGEDATGKSYPIEQSIPEILLVPTNKTLTELTKLLKEGSYNFGYEKCEGYLKETFYRYRKILLGNIEKNIQHLTPQDKEKVYDHIEQLFKHLNFKIIFPEIKLKRPPPDADAAAAAAAGGLFIGIEKHHFIPLTKNFLTSVNCDAFRVFDDFVNSLMEFINIDQENFLINGRTDKGIKFPDRRLFLVLTYVGEYYEKSMTECHVKKPNLDSQVSMDMKNLGLPRLISFEYYNTEPPTLASSGEGGGSKSRRKNSHKSKAKTHRHRRGSKSKSKSRRRSHSRARKHKKYTRRH